MIILVIIFCKNILLFFGQLNDFNCLGNNIDNNFNCYNHDNDDNVGMNFQ